MSATQVPSLRELSAKALLERISPDMRKELVRALDERTKQMLISERASMREYTIEHKIPDVVVFRFQNDISFANRRDAFNAVRAYWSAYSRPPNVFILFACDCDGNFFHEDYSTGDYWSYRLSAQYRGPNTIMVYSVGSPLSWWKITKTSCLLWKHIVQRQNQNLEYLVPAIPKIITETRITFDYDRKLHIAQFANEDDFNDLYEWGDPPSGEVAYTVAIYEMKKY